MELERRGVRKKWVYKMINDRANGKKDDIK
jgi:hypothetical protein